MVKLINWEKENKLALSEEVLNEILICFYQQSVQYILFMSDVWYNFVIYIPETDIIGRVGNVTNWSSS